MGRGTLLLRPTRRVLTEARPRRRGRGWAWRLVGSGRLLGALELHFQPLRADLETVHRVDRRLRRRRVVERHETEALGQIRLFIYEHLGRHDVAERQEGRRQVRVVELLGKVVDEQVTTFGTCNNYRHLVPDLSICQTTVLINV